MLAESLNIVAMSDTHGMHTEMECDIPDGDVLIHAGDFCGRGLMEEVHGFAAWMGSQPHRYKLVTAGNHDRPIEEHEQASREVFANYGIELLIGDTVEIAFIKGSFRNSCIQFAFIKGSFRNSCIQFGKAVCAAVLV